MMEAEVSINDKSLNLMEFSQMRIIEGFITEDSVN